MATALVPRRPDTLWIVGLVIAIYLSLGLLSPFGLAVLKWDYITAGGPALMRFHPSTYLILLTFALVMLRNGRPIANGIAVLRAEPVLVLYIASWALLFYQILVQKQVIGIAVDTFLMPLLALVIVDTLSGEARRPLYFLAHALFLANAGLGLVEFLTGFRLTPMVIPGVPENSDWRSTALFGHPLSNALMMGCYGVMLLLGAGRHLPLLWRKAAFIATHFSMVAFGGRTSLVMLLMADAIAFAIAFLRFLAGGRVKLGTLAMIGLILPVFPVVVGALAQSGFFDKFIDRFIADHGSAKARIVMFDIGSKFTWDELIFGPPKDRLNWLTNTYGIEYGIESTWVAFVYYFGFLVTILFWLGMALLIGVMMRRCDPRAWWVVLFFFLINSTFLGLAGRTYALTFFFMTLLFLMPRSLADPVKPSAPVVAAFPAVGAPC